MPRGSGGPARRPRGARAAPIINNKQLYSNSITTYVTLCIIYNVLWYKI